MGLRFDPAGGGQFKQAVQQLMDIERQPVKALEARKGREEARLKLFQEFKSRFGGVSKALADFTDFRKFRELKVDLGDGSELMSVSMDKTKAEPGVYEIEVDELAQRSSIISNPFESAEEKILGVGYVVMGLTNGETAEIFVDENASSLSGVANLINRQTDAPVRASIIKDATEPNAPFRLLVTAKKDGLDDALDFPEFYFLDGTADFYASEQNDARNASILIDGFEIETEGNQVPDFLTGLSIHLKGARPEKPFTMTISEDYIKVSGKVKSLVDEINKVLEFVNKQNQIDDSSDTRTTFAGDTGLQNIEYRIRNILHQGFPVGDPESENVKLMHLNEIGVEFEKSGMLSFKEEKFTKAMERDFEAVSQAITGPDGIAARLRETFDGYTRTNNGTLSMREQGLRSRIKDVDTQIENKNRMLERKQQALTDQFSKLQGTMANLQRQQQYVSATLGSGGGGMVGQLLGG